MRNERRILLNTLMLGGGEIVGQLSNFVLVASFARAFGAGTLGHYSVSMAVGAIAALFVGMGTQGYLVREISRDPSAARGFVETLLPVQSLLAVAAWLAACGASLLLIGDSRAAGVVAATCGYQILHGLAALLLTPFLATERMLVAVTASWGHRVLMMSLGLAAIWLGADAGTVTLALVVSALVFLVYSWIHLSSGYGRPALRLSPRRTLELFRRASPFFGLAALAVLYGRGGMVILSALVSSSAVGIYAVADRFMVAGGLMPTMFNAAAYPAISRVAHASFVEAKTLVVRCLRLMLLGTIPLATMLAVFSTDIVLLVFGPQYRDSSRVLQVLAWTLPVRGSQWLFGSLLLAIDRQASMARARLAGLCTFFVLTPLMILGMGYIGAAWAVLACDGVQLALYWTILKKAGYAPSCKAALTAPFLASAATFLASAALPVPSLPLRLLFLGLVMASALWATGAVHLHDIRFLRSLVFAKEDR